MRILVVEDELELAETIAEGLRLGILLIQDCYAVHDREEPSISL